MIRIASMGAACGLLALVAGCGGGGGTQTANQAAGTGRVVFRIDWPAKSRFISVTTQSIKVNLVAGGQTFTQTVFGGDGPPANPSTVEFSNVPSGPATFTATAYATTDQTDTPQATASTNLTVHALQNNTVDLTMASTIATIQVTFDTLPVRPGDITVARAVAKDSQGRIVITPGNFQWSSSNTDIATVTNIAAPTNDLNAVGPGTTTITATEFETGKSGSAALEVFTPVFALK